MVTTNATNFRKSLALSIVVIFTLLTIIVSEIPFQAYGDGLTQENVYASVGNRTMAMFIKINPAVITTESIQDRHMQLKFFDARTTLPINNVSFFLNITKGDQKLMYDLFYTHNGTIALKFEPGGTIGTWNVLGDKEPISGGWYSQVTNQVNVQAPILTEGGLYHFNMELLGFDYPNEYVPPYGTKVNFTSYLSVGDIYYNTINYNSKTYNSTMISYFDKIASTSFDPSKIQLLWSMPFDWNLSRYQDRPFLVHEEIRIPNSFKEFVNTPTFSATVNGNPLAPAKIFQDPYGLQNTTIIHIIINKGDIERIAKTMDPNAGAMDFSLAPSKTNMTTATGMFTDFGGWEIKLGWSPTDLNENENEKLDLTFFDQLTGQQVTDDVAYDLKILDFKGNALFSKTNLVARGGTDSQSIVLPSNGIYKIQANITSVTSNGISDTSRLGVARGNLVIPSSTLPEFPFVIPIFVIGFVSLIVLYRLKFKIN